MTQAATAATPDPAAGTGSRGLTSAQARARLDAEGPNELPRPREPHPAGLLLRQFTHLLAILLWVAAGMALLAGMPPLAIAITVVVVLNGVFAFLQEYRADRSTRRLRSLLPSSVRVIRDGTRQLVQAEDLVRGDLVVLEAGTRVPADLRVRQSHGLALDESLVTGESGAVHRKAGEKLSAGTFVQEGEGHAVVEAIGNATTLAGISTLADSAIRPPSPLTVQLATTVRVIAVIAVVVGIALGVGSLALGLHPTQAFLFGVGVAVALVPEGMLPTVTLSLARGAQLMAKHNALVRRLDAIETLGSTTFICTDKTGTLTQNRMAVVDVVTPEGSLQVTGDGYHPEGTITGPEPAVTLAPTVARAALDCVLGSAVERNGAWVADGDAMEAAIHVFALRCGVADRRAAITARHPFTADRMLSSSVSADGVSVLGAPESVLPRCLGLPEDLHANLDALTHSGRRVVAVARRDVPAAGEDPERGLTFLGLLALEDPPRPDVKASLDACRRADIRVAMITGDHPSTAAAIARDVGLLGPDGVVLSAADLPADDAELGALLDRPEGAVVARVTPADKFRIARVLRERGHVVAMTGDGVNDAPAMREADVGVAMGASGSDVARESSDLVLLDDHFATIVTAIELGRATFANIKRFLSYHLTDNVAELAPFALWALSGGRFPLAIGVLQVLALDIGTDILPALALGTEKPDARVMEGRRSRNLIDRRLLVRVFGVLGAAEVVTSTLAFVAVLLSGGWRWGEEPAAGLLATASGTAFATIAIGQMANAFACRSSRVPVWRMNPLGNLFLVEMVAAELGLLVLFVGLPPLAHQLGGTWPSGLGWWLAATGAGAVVLADGLWKTLGPKVPLHPGPMPPV